MQIYVSAVFLANRISGTTRFATEISKRLKKIDPGIRFIAPKNILNKGVAAELDVITYGVSRGYIWEQTMLPIFLMGKKNYLLVNLSNTAPLNIKNHVYLLCGLEYIRFPKAYSPLSRVVLNTLIPAALRNAGHIVTVSNFSKKEICEYYAINLARVSVIPCAVFFDNGDQGKKIPKNEKYLLTVSNLYLHKNLHGLLKAFNIIRKDNPNMLLYIVGVPRRRQKRGAVWKEINSNSHIRYWGSVSDEKLVELYRNAHAFICPSLYEGFGIPPLEAQALGCPVIASDRAALPEVLKDSALYCDPHDIHDISRKIVMLLGGESLRDELIRKGYDNFRRYNWDTSAEQLYQVIQGIIHPKEHQSAPPSTINKAC